MHTMALSKQITQLQSVYNMAIALHGRANMSIFMAMAVCCGVAGDVEGVLEWLDTAKRHRYRILSHHVIHIAQCMCFGNVDAKIEQVIAHILPHLELPVTRIIYQIVIRHLVKSREPDLAIQAYWQMRQLESETEGVEAHYRIETREDGSKVLVPIKPGTSPKYMQLSEGLFVGLLGSLCEQNRVEDAANILVREVCENGWIPSHWAFTRIITIAKELNMVPIGFKLFSLYVEIGYLPSRNIIKAVLGLCTARAGGIPPGLLDLICNHMHRSLDALVKVPGTDILQIQLPERSKLSPAAVATFNRDYTNPDAILPMPLSSGMFNVVYSTTVFHLSSRDPYSLPLLPPELQPEFKRLPVVLSHIFELLIHDDPAMFPHILQLIERSRTLPDTSLFRLVLNVALQSSPVMVVDAFKRLRELHVTLIKEWHELVMAEKNARRQEEERLIADMERREIEGEWSYQSTIDQAHGYDYQQHAVHDVTSSSPSSLPTDEIGMKSVPMMGEEKTWDTVGRQAEERMTEESSDDRLYESNMDASLDLGHEDTFIHSGTREEGEGMRDESLMSTATSSSSIQTNAEKFAQALRHASERTDKGQDAVFVNVPVRRSDGGDLDAFVADVGEGASAPSLPESTASVDMRMQRIIEDVEGGSLVNEQGDRDDGVHQNTKNTVRRKGNSKGEEKEVEAQGNDPRSTSDNSTSSSESDIDSDDVALHGDDMNDTYGAVHSLYNTEVGALMKRGTVTGDDDLEKFKKEETKQLMNMAKTEFNPAIKQVLVDAITNRAPSYDEVLKAAIDDKDRVTDSSNRGRRRQPQSMTQPLDDKTKAKLYHGLQQLDERLRTLQAGIDQGDPDEVPILQELYERTYAEYMESYNLLYGTQAANEGNTTPEDGLSKSHVDAIDAALGVGSGNRDDVLKSVVDVSQFSKSTRLIRKVLTDHAVASDGQSKNKLATERLRRYTIETVRKAVENCEYEVPEDMWMIYAGSILAMKDEGATSLFFKYMEECFAESSGPSLLQHKKEESEETKIDTSCVDVKSTSITQTTTSSSSTGGSRGGLTVCKPDEHQLRIQQQPTPRSSFESLLNAGVGKSPLWVTVYLQSKAKYYGMRHDRVGCVETMLPLIGEFVRSYQRTASSQTQSSVAEHVVHGLGIQSAQGIQGSNHPEVTVTSMLQVMSAMILSDPFKFATDGHNEGALSDTKEPEAHRNTIYTEQTLAEMEQAHQQDNSAAHTNSSESTTSDSKTPLRSYLAVSHDPSLKSLAHPKRIVGRFERQSMKSGSSASSSSSSSASQTEWKEEDEKEAELGLDRRRFDEESDDVFVPATNRHPKKYSETQQRNAYADHEKFLLSVVDDVVSALSKPNADIDPSKDTAQVVLQYLMQGSVVSSLKNKKQSQWGHGLGKSLDEGHNGVVSGMIEEGERLASKANRVKQRLAKRAAMIDARASTQTTQAQSGSSTPSSSSSISLSPTNALPQPVTKPALILERLNTVSLETFAPLGKDALAALVLTCFFSLFANSAKFTAALNVIERLQQLNVSLALPVLQELCGRILTHNDGESEQFLSIVNTFSGIVFKSVVHASLPPIVGSPDDITPALVTASLHEINLKRNLSTSSLSVTPSSSSASTTWPPLTLRSTTSNHVDLVQSIYDPEVNRCGHNTLLITRSPYSPIHTPSTPNAPLVRVPRTIVDGIRGRTSWPVDISHYVWSSMRLFYEDMLNDAAVRESSSVVSAIIQQIAQFRLPVDSQFLDMCVDSLLADRSGEDYLGFVEHTGTSNADVDDVQRATAALGKSRHTGVIDIATKLLSLCEQLGTPPSLTSYISLARIAHVRRSGVLIEGIVASVQQFRVPMTQTLATELVRACRLAVFYGHSTAPLPLPPGSRIAYTVYKLLRENNTTPDEPVCQTHVYPINFAIIPSSLIDSFLHLSTPVPYRILIIFQRDTAAPSPLLSSIHYLFHLLPIMLPCIICSLLCFPAIL